MLRLAYILSGCWLVQLTSAGSLGSTDLGPFVAGVPLFKYETEHLTEDILRRIPVEFAHLFAFNTTSPILRQGECKPLPGDANWPSQSEWRVLNATLGGALISTVPVAAPCYHNWGVYDADKCAALTSNWIEPWFHEEDPTSLMWPVWEGLSCLPTEHPNSTDCTLGAFPAYTVNATSVAHIQTAVNFARNKGLRLVIKNTGHDYLGKSSGAGALSIWTHHLQDIDYLAEYTLGDYAGKALHVGAGVRGRDVYRTAEENDASIVGGMCESVGFAGGYFAGGGHSPLSGKYGMAADHILAIGVVTADGHYRTVTEKTHPDLYWAIRGGGGSTFGVTTSVIVGLHPQMEVTTSKVAFATSRDVSNETFWLGVKELFSHFDGFGDAGFYTYMHLQRDYNGASYGLEIESMVAPNMSIAGYHEVTEPFFDRLTELGIPFKNVPKNYATVHPALKEAWPADIDHIGTMYGSWATRLFPTEIWNDPAGFNSSFDAVRKVAEAGYPIAAWQIAPGNPSQANNAVNPAFRHARAFFSSGVMFPTNATPSQMTASYKELRANILDPWREAAPASSFGGSYLNEGSVMEPYWQDDFYGSHYPELLRIKQKWDPNGLFYATTGVGSDDWEVRTQEQGVQTQNGPLCRRQTSGVVAMDATVKDDAQVRLTR
ncbi:VAO-type flavoprotein oxidase [Cladobotryum mycophilum]|uniref:VAO-type flavoprotein oxidase n=1 Tax=Cladobotryum mycophilum TaxID=491253 RepID=A0ABR0SPP2_9HYPO